MRTKFCAVLFAATMTCAFVAGCSGENGERTDFDPPGDAGIDDEIPADAAGGRDPGDGGTGGVGGSGGTGGSGGAGQIDGCDVDSDCSGTDYGECWALVCEYHLCVNRPVADGTTCGAPPGQNGTCKQGGCTFSPSTNTCIDGIKPCAGWWECTIPDGWEGCGYPACEAGCCTMQTCS
jgi:hypothetical protein